MENEPIASDGNNASDRHVQNISKVKQKFQRIRAASSLLQNVRDANNKSLRKQTSDSSVLSSSFATLVFDQEIKKLNMLRSGEVLNNEAQYYRNIQKLDSEIETRDDEHRKSVSFKANRIANYGGKSLTHPKIDLVIAELATSPYNTSNFMEHQLHKEIHQLRFNSASAPDLRYIQSPQKYKNGITGERNHNLEEPQQHIRPDTSPAMSSTNDHDKELCKEEGKESGKELGKKGYYREVKSAHGKVKTKKQHGVNRNYVFDPSSNEGGGSPFVFPHSPARHAASARAKDSVPASCVGLQNTQQQIVAGGEKDKHAVQSRLAPEEARSGRNAKDLQLELRHVYEKKFKDVVQYKKGGLYPHQKKSSKIVYRINGRLYTPRKESYVLEKINASPSPSSAHGHGHGRGRGCGSPPQSNDEANFSWNISDDEDNNSNNSNEKPLRRDKIPAPPSPPSSPTFHTDLEVLGRTENAFDCFAEEDEDSGEAYNLFTFSQLENLSKCSGDLVATGSTHGLVPTSALANIHIPDDDTILQMELNPSPKSVLVQCLGRMLYSSSNHMVASRPASAGMAGITSPQTLWQHSASQRQCSKESVREPVSLQILANQNESKKGRPVVARKKRTTEWIS